MQIDNSKNICQWLIFKTNMFQITGKLSVISVHAQMKPFFSERNRFTRLNIHLLTIFFKRYLHPPSLHRQFKRPQLITFHIKSSSQHFNTHQIRLNQERTATAPHHIKQCIPCNFTSRFSGKKCSGYCNKVSPPK